jgi:hypothetical protein
VHAVVVDVSSDAHAKHPQGRGVDRIVRDLGVELVQLPQHGRRVLLGGLLPPPPGLRGRRGGRRRRGDGGGRGAARRPRGGGVLAGRRTAAAAAAAVVDAAAEAAAASSTPPPPPDDDSSATLSAFLRTSIRRWARITSLPASCISSSTREGSTTSIRGTPFPKQ